MNELLQTCRTCKNKDDNLLPISSQIELNNRIVDYFKTYLQLNILEDDNIPSNICLKCLNKLLDVRKFYLQCRDSENYFRLKSQIPINNINSKFIKLCGSQEKLQNDCNKANENFDSNECLNSHNSLYNYKETFIIKKDDLNEEYLELNEFESTKNFEAQKKLGEENPNENSENNSISSEQFVHYEILDEYATDINISQVEFKKEIYECEECHESFKYYKNLQLHITLNHRVKNLHYSKIDSILYESTKCFNKTALTCKQCRRNFVFKTNYNIHKKTHSKKKTNSNESCICAVCGKKFDSERKLQKHNYRHKNKFKEIPCPICKKIFKAKYHLKIHMNQHTGAKPFSCNICSKKFVSRSSLKLHKTLHEGKKIQCPMCDTKLAAKTQLKLHMRMHTNERPYACTQCPKAYKQLCALKVHIATHSGIKSVQCEECSACFYSKNHLLSHKIKIHRPKKFHCNKCPRQFSTPSQMKIHLSKVHEICTNDLTPYVIISN